MQSCSELRHAYQQLPTGKWEEVIYSGPINDATIYLRQPIPPNQPSITPPQLTGHRRGWCEVPPGQPIVEPIIYDSQPQTTTTQTADSAPRPPLPKAAEVLDIGIALFLFAGLATLIYAVTYHLSPPPSASPQSYAEPPMMTGDDHDEGPLGDGQRSVSGDHDETQQKPNDHDPDELFDLTGITLTEFKDDLCEGVANGGKGFEAMDVLNPKKQPAIMKAVHDYIDEYGPQKTQFCLWQVFRLTRKTGDSPYAQRCQMGMDFIAREFASYDPTDVF